MKQLNTRYELLVFKTKMLSKTGRKREAEQQKAVFVENLKSKSSMSFFFFNLLEKFVAWTKL